MSATKTPEPNRSNNQKITQAKGEEKTKKKKKQKQKKSFFSLPDVPAILRRFQTRLPHFETSLTTYKHCELKNSMLEESPLTYRPCHRTWLQNEASAALSPHSPP
jgi:hypothetical protein